MVITQANNDSKDAPRNYPKVMLKPLQSYNQISTHSIPQRTKYLQPIGTIRLQPMNSGGYKPSIVF